MPPDNEVSLGRSMPVDARPLAPLERGMAKVDRVKPPECAAG